MSNDEKVALRNTFKGYKRVNTAMLKMLNKYNLVVTSYGKHYKIHRHDNIGGSVTLAKTPSDGRAGLNISKYIIQLIEA